MPRRLPMRALWSWLLLVGFAHDPATPPPAAAPRGSPTAEPQGQVVVELVGLRNDRGQVLAALFRSAQGFPNGVEHAFARQTAHIHDKQLRLTFDHVPEGPFAIGVHHDENANFQMETGPFGMPKEGYGVSRDAPASFGPPKFDAARLTLTAAEHKHIVVHMKY
jgi:uncharacterized protein (DUF2141 family)